MRSDEDMINNDMDKVFGWLLLFDMAVDKSLLVSHAKHQVSCNNIRLLQDNSSLGLSMVRRHLKYEKKR